MGDIVQFTGPARRTDREVHAEKARAIALGTLRRIEARAKEKGRPLLKLTSTADKRSAATALGRLWRSAQESGVSTEDLTARFPKPFRYMLLGQGNDEAKLQKMPGVMRNFLECAEAICRLVGLNEAKEDQAKIAILRSTALWANPACETGVDERFVLLVGQIEAVVQRVVKKHRVKEMFDKARKVPGTWDSLEQQFIESTMACLFRRAYAYHYEHWEEAPPLCTVPLIRILHHRIRTTAVVGPEVENVRRAHLQTVETIDGEQIKVELDLYRELGLAIGPIDTPENIGPLIETRAHIAVGVVEDDAT